MGSEQMIKFWWRSRSRIQIWIRVRHALVEVYTVLVLLVYTVIYFLNWTVFWATQVDVWATCCRCFGDSVLGDVILAVLSCYLTLLLAAITTAEKQLLWVMPFVGHLICKRYCCSYPQGFICQLLLIRKNLWWVWEVELLVKLRVFLLCWDLFFVFTVLFY